MNPEVKAEWVAALRSGQYMQGTNNLRTERGFCCLGVLCDLAVKHEIIPAPGRGTAYPHVYRYGFDSKFLPEAVRMWAGLPDTDPDVHRENETNSLSVMNDGGCTFEEIADVIEENFTVEEVAAPE